MKDKAVEVAVVDVGAAEEEIGAVRVGELISVRDRDEVTDVATEGAVVNETLAVA